MIISMILKNQIPNYMDLPGYQFRRNVDYYLIHWGLQPCYQRADRNLNFRFRKWFILLFQIISLIVVLLDYICH
jgi:hypothetical protein